MASQAFKNQLILFIKSNKSNASQQKMKTPPINTKIINTLPVFFKLPDCRAVGLLAKLDALQPCAVSRHYRGRFGGLGQRFNR